jgi:hypothetical protein
MGFLFFEIAIQKNNIPFKRAFEGPENSAPFSPKYLLNCRLISIKNAKAYESENQDLGIWATTDLL